MTIRTTISQRKMMVISIYFISLNIRVVLILNKHFEILVNCSDKERNCIQAHETAWLMELHVSSLDFMKVQGTACKLRELHASS